MKKAPPFLLAVCIAFSLFFAPSPSAAAAQATVVNAASYENSVAPGSIGALFGADLSTQTQSASSLPLPLTLGGVSVKNRGQASATLLRFALAAQFANTQRNQRRRRVGRSLQRDQYVADCHGHDGSCCRSTGRLHCWGNGARTGDCA